MWICKFQGYDKESELTKFIIKNNIELFYYPEKSYEKSGRHFFSVIAMMKGEEIDKKRFIKDIKNAKGPRKVDFLESEGDVFTLITSHTSTRELKKQINVFYNKEIIHYKPVIFHKNGWEEWEIASINREPIEKLIKVVEEIYELKLLSFKKEKIKTFSFFTPTLDLTRKQENSIRLALENGYYRYPRKTSLDKLSKIAKLSFSTFQAHVRKAENKIISSIIK
ncbi:MAG: helix-turn-helix domain-containing protein [Nanoarchaeota archaeon]|nr:helix-turn-helix domain-containing protein [Nanoarchaeota archaeon]